MNDLVYGISFSTWEKLPLQVKGSLAIAWTVFDIDRKINMLNFFTSLNEENKQIMLQGLYARSKYYQLIEEQ